MAVRFTRSGPDSAGRRGNLPAERSRRARLSWPDATDAARGWSRQARPAWVLGSALRAFHACARPQDDRIRGARPAWVLGSALRAFRACARPQDDRIRGARPTWVPGSALRTFRACTRPQDDRIRGARPAWVLGSALRAFRACARPQDDRVRGARSGRGGARWLFGSRDRGRIGRAAGKDGHRAGDARSGPATRLGGVARSARREPAGQSAEGRTTAPRRGPRRRPPRGAATPRGGRVRPGRLAG